MRIDRTKLRIAMLRAGLETNRELSKTSGVNPNTLSAITNGKTCVMATIQKLAYALNVEPETLLED